MNVLTILGARPQFVKAAMVSRAVRRMGNLQERILHTGQHHDFKMSAVFFRDMGIPEPAVHLQGKSQLHKGVVTQGAQTGQILMGIEKELNRSRPAGVLIYGDTNSTIAGALAAAKLGVPVAHVEAGLRSFNRSMPEEINRVVADRLSDLLFAPTQTAVKNLAHEGIRKGVHRVGDVMIDAIFFFRSRARQRTQGRSRFPLPPGPFFMLTLHRQENTDHADCLSAILDGLAESPIPFVFPLHPRTKGFLKHHRLKLPKRILPYEPLSYLDMIHLQDRSVAVWTDSGGVQKEAVVIGKPCFTLRQETEWVETVREGWNMLLGAETRNIRAVFRKRAWETHRKPFPTRAYYGDGHAAERITKILANRL